ncbi:MAG: hypothetical protein C0467_23160 [Planctomycetaceae bacterium]|nr:hypothetical protein [Planctomycetaceae bacterium]
MTRWFAARRAVIETEEAQVKHMQEQVELATTEERLDDAALFNDLWNEQAKIVSDLRDHYNRQASRFNSRGYNLPLLD